MIKVKELKQPQLSKKNLSLILHCKINKIKIEATNPQLPNILSPNTKIKPIPPQFSNPDFLTFLNILHTSINSFDLNTIFTNTTYLTKLLKAYILSKINNNISTSPPEFKKSNTPKHSTKYNNLFNIVKSLFNITNKTKNNYKLNNKYSVDNADNNVDKIDINSLNGWNVGLEDLKFLTKRRILEIINEVDGKEIEIGGEGFEVSDIYLGIKDFGILAITSKEIRKAVIFEMIISTLAEELPNLFRYLGSNEILKLGKFIYSLWSIYIIDRLLLGIETGLVNYYKPLNEQVRRYLNYLIQSNKINKQFISLPSQLQLTFHLPIQLPNNTNNEIINNFLSWLFNEFINGKLLDIGKNQKLEDFKKYITEIKGIIKTINDKNSNKIKNRIISNIVNDLGIPAQSVEIFFNDFIDQTALLIEYIDKIIYKEIRSLFVGFLSNGIVINEIKFNYEKTKQLLTISLSLNILGNDKNRIKTNLIVELFGSNILNKNSSSSLSTSISIPVSNQPDGKFIEFTSSNTLIDFIIVDKIQLIKFFLREYIYGKITADIFREILECKKSIQLIKNFYKSNIKYNHRFDLLYLINQACSGKRFINILNSLKNFKGRIKIQNQILYSPSLYELFAYLLSNIVTNRKYYLISIINFHTNINNIYNLFKTFLTILTNNILPEFIWNIYKEYSILNELSLLTNNIEDNIENSNVNSNNNKIRNKDVNLLLIDPKSFIGKSILDVINEELIDKYFDEFHKFIKLILQIWQDVDLGNNRLQGWPIIHLLSKIFIHKIENITNSISIKDINKSISNNSNINSLLMELIEQIIMI